jgi:hypothetical protein
LPPPALGDTLVFVLEYTVTGGLWVYPEAARLEWRALPADRSGLAVPQKPGERDPANGRCRRSVVCRSVWSRVHAWKLPTMADSTTVVYEASEAVVDGTAFQVLLDFPPEVVTAVPQPWQIAEDTAQLEYSIDQIDMTIDVQPDGTLHVRETQQVSVQAGVLYSGYRQFSLLFTDDIQIVGVYEGEVPFTAVDLESASSCVRLLHGGSRRQPSAGGPGYNPANDEVDIFEEAGGEVLLKWNVLPLVAGESGQFTLEYLVEGVVLPRADNQQINWTAVANYDVPINNVQITWLLPNGLGLEDVQFSGGDVSRTEGRGAADQHAPIAPNSPWQIELTLPPDATSAQPRTGSARSRPRLPKARRLRCARRATTWPRWWARFWWELRPFLGPSPTGTCAAAANCGNAWATTAPSHPRSCHRVWSTTWLKAK